MITAIRRTELHEETNTEKNQYNITTAQTTISNTRTAHLITFSCFSLFFLLLQFLSSHFPNIPPLSPLLQLISFFFSFFRFLFLSSFLPSLPFYSFPPRFLFFLTLSFLTDHTMHIHMQISHSSHRRRWPIHHPLPIP